MDPREDKRIMLKAAYGYFQDGHWDRALDEYTKLFRIDPKDYNLQNMIADIQAKKGAKAEAVKSYLGAAALQREQGLLEKELATCRKALRLDPASAAALARCRESQGLVLGQAERLVAEGRLDEAESLCGKVLEADSSSLEANRVLDAVKARRQMDAAGAQAAPAREEAPTADPTAELVNKLYAMSESYLAGEDYDNAIECLATILKFSPDLVAVRNRLFEVREILEKKRQAEEVWTKMQEEETERLEEMKRAQAEAEMRERLRQEEAEARSRMEAQMQALEAAAQRDQMIVEKAAQEMRQRMAAGSEAPAPPPAPPDAQERELRERYEREAQERERRHHEEAEALRRQLEKERQEAEARARERESQLKAEADLLKHQMELARLEAEARARQAAAEELSRRMEEEHRLYEQRLAKEREEQARREESFRAQMEALMKQQAQKLEQEVRERALADLKEQMDRQSRQRAEAESEAAAAKEASLSALKAQQEAQRRAGEEAEAKARAEREALAKLQQDEEDRKTQIFRQAMERRGKRLEGQGEERAEVLKASRRISDAMKAAATKHMEQDLNAMVSTAYSYVRQDLLQDAMRMCQKIAEIDPQNQEMKGILKEIFQKKGI